MSITIKVGKFDVTVSNAAEAAALLRELESTENKATAENPKPSIHSQEAEDHKADATSFDPAIATMTLRFLKAIRDGGSSGVQSEAIMKALEVERPKAVGSRSAAVNRLLKGLQFSPGKVYDNPKTFNGRIWTPKKQMQAAITALEQRMGAH